MPQRSISVFEHDERSKMFKTENTSVQCPGVLLGNPVPGGYKYGNLALQIGGVSNETVKYGYGSERLGPLSDYTANCRPVLSSERAHHRYRTVNFRQQHSDRK
jgi:hypothetical protein